MLQLMTRPMNRMKLWAVAAACLAAISAAPVSAQRVHEPFLRRDLPATAWSFDGRDDRRDFQTNGFFPGDFAAHPAGAWIGAAGLFGSTPSGGSHFGPVYCMRRYRPHGPMPGYFQGYDGTWYRCRSS